MNSANSSKKPKTEKRRFGYNIWYDFVKITGMLPVLLMLRTKIIYTGKKPTNRGGVLVSANHVGMLDPIIVLTVFKFRRPHFLATDNLYRTKLSAAFFDSMHCIRTDRQNFSISAFRTITDRLASGIAVVIFPEGQINKTEKNGVLPFKDGISFMAYKGKSPILPIYIIKREKWYQRQKVIVGESIDMTSTLGDQPSMEQINGISLLLQEKELELRDYYQTHFK